MTYRLTQIELNVLCDKGREWLKTETVLAEPFAFAYNLFNKSHASGIRIVEKEREDGSTDLSLVARFDLGSYSYKVWVTVNSDIEKIVSIRLSHSVQSAKLAAKIDISDMGFVNYTKALTSIMGLVDAHNHGKIVLEFRDR